MSVPMNPAAPPAKQRPSSVTISSYLLFLVAALQVLSLIMTLSMMGTISDVYEEAYAGTEAADTAGTIGVATLVISSVVMLLIAIGLVVLAIFNNRGKNPSRIVTWVLGAILLCCSGLGLIGQAVGSALDMGGAPTDPNAPDPAEVQRLLEERLPSWFNPASTVISIVTLLALLVALILLALPASNEFFRKPQPVWEPPVPGATYPAYPGQAEPGYPQQGTPGYPQQGGPGYPPANPPGQSGPPSPPTSPPPPPPAQ